jgi:hypothetical protein
MEEYREENMPDPTSAMQCQDVMMDPWQMMVANFDAEMADGKETIGRNLPNKVFEKNILCTLWVRYLLDLQ